MNRGSHELDYGFVDVGPVDGCWRQDTYRPKDGGRAVVERIMCAGPDDVSAPHNKMTYGPGAGYDPECSCCWLGIHHTKDKHARSVGGGRCR